MCNTLAGIIASLAFAASAEGIPETAAPVRVNEQGLLVKNGEPLRAHGINYFNAFLRRIKDPDDTTYREGFAELGARDIPFVRFNAGGFWPVNYKLYQEDPEAWWAIMDDVVRSAEENGIGLIPSLCWYYACIPDLVGEPISAWGDPDSKTIAFMRQYTREMVGRYKDSPTIWAWELGNEYNLTHDIPGEEHRAWIHPHLGTPETRGPADDLTHDMVVTAAREFAKAVREIDPVRPVTTGHSNPRQSAFHLRTEGTWGRDSREQYIQTLIDQTPDPNDLISVHVYPLDHENRFGLDYATYGDMLAQAMKASAKAGKPLFAGEYGAPDNNEGGHDFAVRENYRLITEFERAGVPLTALWNYDLPQQEEFINITPGNHRGYLLEALRQANLRLPYLMEGGCVAELAAGNLSGRLLDNLANAGRQESGFNPLDHALYPGRGIYRHDAVGLNFEHIFNGAAADRGLAMFTPRTDPCVLTQVDRMTATLEWAAEDSSWNMDCTMTYTMAEPSAIDITFSATPREDRFPLGYAAFMWASYMNTARDRRIYFPGPDGWTTFGEDTADGFETGAVGAAGSEPLPFEEGAETLNIPQHPEKQFSEPFYYGLLDGDGDPETADDTLAYIMMFDQTEPIRFALWNFIPGADGKPDTRSPAWDWQFVVRNPDPGTTYSYRARVVVKPFVSREDVRDEYARWKASLGE